jgi:3-hexulose-6-phosphate synthase/6-phospho-3-hexuloisomerase
VTSCGCSLPAKKKATAKGAPSGEVTLQVAVDTTTLKRGLQIAREASAGGAQWIEVGTPLLKSEGMEAVRAFARGLKGRTIVADMKTADVGGAEVELAAKAGARVVHVLASAHDETIRDAVRAGRKYGTMIAIDLMGIGDKVARAREVEAMGVHHVSVHVGVDEQMVGLSPVKMVRAVAEAVSIPVAAAGGLNSESAPAVVKAGATIIIVGGAITKAEEPKAATAKILKAINQRKALPTELFRKYAQSELKQAFVMASTPNITDANHRKGAMKGIRSVAAHGVKMVGRAVTVRTVNGDWAKPVEAIDVAKPGEVIVIDAQGGEIAVWGELASWSSKVKGIAGVVIDGAIRDVPDIRAMGFAAFARHISPDAGEPKGHGEIGAEIICGGQTVRGGDWVIGDDSGVVVVPQERAVEIANRAVNVFETENRLREEIRRGSTLSKQLELEKWEKVG